MLLKETFGSLFIFVPMNKQRLLGLELEDLQAIVATEGLPKFAAKQIADWIYKKRVRSIDEMSNLSIKARATLNEKYEVGFVNYSTVQASIDGTKKYLFPVSVGGDVESVYIPEEDRSTLCISSQVGCAMGCRFCMTGKQGFSGDLTSGDILNQIFALPEIENLTNFVLMGMGEPLNNPDNVFKALRILTADYGPSYSPKRITLSTVGIIPNLITFLDDSKCHLAISLHSPFNEIRKKIMAVEYKYPIEEVIQVLRNYDFEAQRRLSFEYIVFDGVTDRKEDVVQLAKLLDGLKCRINLIRYHKIPDVDLVGINDKKMEWFKNELEKKGFVTTIRRSRGEDIFAACGMLSSKKKEGQV